MYWIIKTNQRKEYIKPIPTNESGALMWQGIEEGLGVEELAELLLEKYNLKPEEAALDVKRFLIEISQNGLKTYLDEKGIY